MNHMCGSLMLPDDFCLPLIEQPGSIQSGMECLTEQPGSVQFGMECTNE